MTETNTNKRKCSRCKVNLPLTAFKIKRNGEYKKRCEFCCEKTREYANRYKCPHNKLKYTCKECGGSQICLHNRAKSQCKECCGGSICPHNRVKSVCKECGGGSQICQHNRIKYTCKECGGSQICPHNRIKSRCKECGGGSICEHNSLRTQCKQCNFSGYLSSIVRTRIHNALKCKKSKKTFEYLGCDVEIFKEHIEKQFKDGMSWDNHGEWHIDHIIPLKYNKPTIEQTIKRLHYTNTQPLWASDNISKGNRYIG